MSRITEKFADLEKRREAALIPFITAGDPNLATTLKILHAIEGAGADLIELGIPFSDPTADGPTIQRSSQRALKNQPSIPAILRIVRQFRRHSDLPLILFGYYNPFFHFGVKEFCQQASRAGADGILCVDLPPEESDELKRWTDASALDLIFLLSPTSGDDRIEMVARKSRGFIYYVSVTGVTGARPSFDRTLRSQVARVRKASGLPIGVGFGISTPQQAAWIAGFADAAVVGSSLMNAIERAAGRDEKPRQAGRFVANLKRSMLKIKR